jgi:hypothetical protein
MQCAWVGGWVVAQCVGAFLQADPLVACMNAYRHAGASRVDKML